MCHPRASHAVPYYITALVIRTCNIPRMQTCTGVVGVVVFLITRDCTVVGKTLRPPSSSLESHFYFEFIFLPRFTFTDVLLFFVCLLHANSFGLLIRLECFICKRRRRNYLFSSVLCYNLRPLAICRCLTSR